MPRRAYADGRHYQAKCTFTIKGALHIDFEPAAAVGRPLPFLIYSHAATQKTAAAAEDLARCVNLTTPSGRLLLRLTAHDRTTFEGLRGAVRVTTRFAKRARKSREPGKSRFGGSLTFWHFFGGNSFEKFPRNYLERLSDSSSGAIHR